MDSITLSDQKLKGNRRCYMGLNVVLGPWLKKFLND